MHKVTTCKQHTIDIEVLLPLNQIECCPVCGNANVSIRDYDEYDMLSTSFGIPRILIIKIERAYFQVRGVTYFSLKSFIRESLNLSETTGYSPITCSCIECGSTFRFHRNELNPIREAPTYCPFCGKPSVVVSQDTELDVWEVLANAYSLPIPVIKIFYQAFTQQPDYIHFSEFLKMTMREMAAKMEVK